jgi:soluble lytic murein transglycosylase-like protein
MQMVPGTGLLVAQKLGLPWAAARRCTIRPRTSDWGTAYMRQMLDRYDGQAYLAIAAYNAGPAPLERWRAARGNLDPDFFVESIPVRKRANTSRACSPSAWSTTGASTATPRRCPSACAGAWSPIRSSAAPSPARPPAVAAMSPLRSSCSAAAASSAAPARAPAARRPRACRCSAATSPRMPNACCRRRGAAQVDVYDPDALRAPSPARTR